MAKTPILRLFVSPGGEVFEHFAVGRLLLVFVLHMLLKDSNDVIVH